MLISCHVTSLSWQELEEELNKLLLMKVYGRDRNVKVKMCGCVEVIHCASKNVAPMACYNFDTHQQILIFFGRNVTDKVGNQMML